MLGKIKELFEVQQGLAELKDEIAAHKKLVAELSMQYQQEVAALVAFRTQQEQAAKTNSTQAAASLEELRAGVRQELDEFRALNKGIQKQMLQRFEQELAEQFLEYGRQLGVDKTAYAKIRADIESAGKALVQLNSNIARLAEVSLAIRKEDFELSQYHKQMLVEDKIKLELMQKIDTLERLMAAMRRGKQQEEPMQRRAPYA